VLGRGGEPADVAAGIRYLLSATAVTGQMIAVDGGQNLIWQTPDVEVME
jgi:NAD(P)-dependent dehydrogenase (short-subunit alcohol dehydrogenase family)